MTSAARTASSATASGPLARLHAVRDYANRVFGDEGVAATWLSRAHRSVRDGLCSVGAACQSAEGFDEALAELRRIELLDRGAQLAYARARFAEIAVRERG